MRLGVGFRGRLCCSTKVSARPSPRLDRELGILRPCGHTVAFAVLMKASPLLRYYFTTA